MDSLFLEVVAALSCHSKSTASGTSVCMEQGPPLLHSIGSVIVPSNIQGKSQSLRKSASETFKER